MCGQLGIILGRKRRRAEEREYFKQVFTRLLLLSEPRGPYATGLAWVNRAGQHRIYKAPLPAGRFIEEKDYRATLDGVDNTTTILMGHTRWPTRGDVQNNLNNHPIRSLDCIGTHNGHILNADSLFRRFRLRRHAEVDSEIIFRLGGRMMNKDGQINLDRLIAKLAFLRGQMSAVLVSRRDPGTVLILKGDKPLHLWFHSRRCAVVYASDEAYVRETLLSDKGWRSLDIPPMTLVVFNHDAIQDFTTLPLCFISRPGRSILTQGLGP